MISERPRISIVTPCFNHAEFLEETLLSVLDQGYPDLEYGVVDGGSRDGSVDILRKYGDRLSFWTSERDKGMYDALNKGFARTSGEIMGWINSDDKYLPSTLSIVGELFTLFPAVEWLTSAYPLHWDREGRATACFYAGGFNRKAFLRGCNLPGFGPKQSRWIQQESTFWRRSLWERAGGALDTASIAGDFELWCRFFRHAELYSVATPLAGFRVHGDQISVQRKEEYLQACARLLQREGGRPYGPLKGPLRSLWGLAMGGRSLRKLPPRIGDALCGLGLLWPAWTCKWQEGQWTLSQDYLP